MLLASLTSLQIAEWYAFLNLEPVGELRADYRTGVLCATVANYAGKARSGDCEAAQPAEFFSTLDALRPAAPADTALLMPTAEQQAELIKSVIFKVPNG